jgi:hypothetical protein
MQPREILQHRLTTLSALLEGPTLSGGDGELSVRLRDQWSSERALIQRLLEDSGGGSVLDTMTLWRSRTERFLASSGDQVPGWVDVRGQRWDARRVLELLDELSGRVDSWTSGGGSVP